jgi:cholest-4-en-3-one 26-monooxygenase
MADSPTIPALEGIDLMDASVFAAARDAEAFRVLRDEAPLFWNDEPTGGPGFWSVTRYADIDTVAKDAERFRNAAGTQIEDRRAEGEGPAQIHNLDAPRHRQLRSLLTSTFSPKRVRGMTERVREVSDRLIDEALEVGEVDLVEAFSAKLPLLVLLPMLGVPLADADRVLTWTNQMASEDPEFSGGPETAAHARDELFAYYQGLTEKRRAEPADDIVTTLVQSRPDGKLLKEDELGPYYQVLTVAGNETTRNLISGAVHTLCERELWPRLRTNPDMLEPGIEEMLRWVSPVINMRRTAATDVEIHGHTIRAGEKAVLWFASGNRDERAFDRPGEVILDRSPNKHLAFGSGPHFCLGAHLARLEARTLFQQLLNRDVRIELRGEPDRLLSNWFRGIKHLPVRLSRGSTVA